MISREDQTWTNVMNNGGAEQFEIAISLGRIADMLAEMNNYIVEYGEQPRAEEAHDAVPVIRCHECKHCLEEAKNEYWCYGFCSPAKRVRVRKDDFCSFAEAKAKRKVCNADKSAD